MEMMRGPLMQKLASFFIALTLACIAGTIAGTITLLPLFFLSLSFSGFLNVLLAVVGTGLALLTAIVAFKKVYPYFRQQLKEL
jgi:hypothetical protein